MKIRGGRPVLRSTFQRGVRVGVVTAVTIWARGRAGCAGDAFPIATGIATIGASVPVPTEPEFLGGHMCGKKRPPALEMLAVERRGTQDPGKHHPWGLCLPSKIVNLRVPHELASPHPHFTYSIGE